MPLTLEETNSLVTALGVAVPPTVLAEKARAEEFKTRLKETTAKAGAKPGDWWLKPKFDAALNQASASAASRQFDPAFKALDEADQLLLQPDAPLAAPPEPPKAPESPAAKPAEEPGTSLVQLQKSRLAWDTLRKRVRTQLEQIEQSILAGVKEHNADETAEDQFEEAEVGAAIKTLYTVLGEHDERLLDKLDEALNAKSEADRRTRHQEAAAIIQEYQSFVGSDATLAIIDENGFTKSTIRAEVTGTLSELAGKF